MKASGEGGHSHAVRFYEDDRSLCRIVSGFIAEGLALDQPALIIATKTHIDAIVENLSRATIDVELLEMLWNRLANTHDFSLLCGYAMGNFYREATIDDVCRHHTHVVSDTGEIALVS
jgi:hypothetical protein